MDGGRQFKISSYKAFFAQLKSRSLNSVGFCFISNWKETEITWTSLDQPYPHTHIYQLKPVWSFETQTTPPYWPHILFVPHPHTHTKSRPAATFNCCQTKRSCCICIKWIIAIKKKKLEHHRSPFTVCSLGWAGLTIPSSDICSLRASSWTQKWSSSSKHYKCKIDMVSINIQWIW